MEQAARSPADGIADTGPAAGAAPVTETMHPVTWEGLSVGLVLLVDEYLTTLGQEIGMVRLDHGPGPVSDATGRLELVDTILVGYASAREAVRRMAEAAYDAGHSTFDVEVELPEIAATAALALERTMRDIQDLSRQGRILLPPLEPEAAEFFSAFLLSAARQILGEETLDELSRVTLAEVAAVLEDRRRQPARFVGTSRIRDERRRASSSFGRDLPSAKVARRFVVDTLDRWGYAEQAQRAELPVAELLANALLHSRQEMDVVLVAGDEAVRVEVHDRATARPMVRRRGTEADSGRGLLLVDALVDRWGCDDESGMAKRVWVEFDAAATAPAEGASGPGAVAARPAERGGAPALLGTLSEAALYRAALEALEDTTVFVFGPDLRVTLAGAALGRLGWRTEEIVGMRPAEILGEPHGPAFEELQRAALAGERGYLEIEGIRWADAVWGITVLPLRDDGGEVVGGVVVARDMATLRRAQAEQRRIEETAEASAQMAETERRLRERLQFLAEINEVLAGATDRREVMAVATRAAVPRLGDWCVINVFLDHRDPVPAIEVAHVDPAMVSKARALQERFPYDPAAPRGVPAVIRNGRPEFFPEIDDTLLADLELGEEESAVVRELALRSAITVPLVKGRQVLGAMQFVISGPERRYDADDLRLAVAVAGRVASSLDNRRLVEQERHIAETLQRSLLPESLPTVPGVEIAVRYWAVGEGAEVGGDFYDLFEITEGRHAIVVGDVCGNGPKAAAVTASARHTVRACAWRGDDPGAVLGQLNAAILRTWPDTLCTVAYATLDSAGRRPRLTLALAGHPPPVLVRADGTAELVGAPGLLLGAIEPVDHEVATIELGPGDVVVLYTDGATDLPPPDWLGPEQVTRMVAEAAAGGGDAESIVERLSDALEARKAFPEREDDIALVVLRGAPG